MKKAYEAPEIDIYKYSEIDVFTESTNIDEGEENPFNAFGE